MARLTPPDRPSADRSADRAAGRPAGRPDVRHRAPHVPDARLDRDDDLDEFPVDPLIGDLFDEMGDEAGDQAGDATPGAAYPPDFGDDLDPDFDDEFVEEPEPLIYYGPERTQVAGRAVSTDRDSDREYASPRASRWHTWRFGVLTAAVAVALIVVTWAAWSVVLEAVAESAATLATREADGRTRASVTVALTALAVLGFIVSWWRASHPRRPVRLSDGRGTMSVDAIAGQLRAAILDLPEVRAAEVMVENRGGGQVRVRTQLQVTAEARIDNALDGVDDAADWLVHHRLGLMLTEPPLAEVRYDELDLRAARAASGGGPARRPDGERDD